MACWGSRARVATWQGQESPTIESDYVFKHMPWLSAQPWYSSGTVERNKNNKNMQPRSAERPDTCKNELETASVHLFW